ncbi:sialidase family protein [Algoriphagus sp. NG3]|uniref:sialidase family protein n=1 Tax=Algoriphagus sp. NG3 TaxID=3097546 RepID=UPI002A80EA66|nr:sialidase family protein [Algoriphagus sp. NG3]WPR77447.1 sialidase family protein [Algoriphagus sp. NG3]
MISQPKDFTILFLSILLLFGCREDSQVDWKSGILTDEFIFDEAPFPSCHSATIAETPSGLVSAWFGGTRERHPDVGIWLSRHENDGWTAPMEVANGVINDTLRYPTWNPVLYQVPDGGLLLFFKIGPKPSEWWGMLMSSNDDGITWSTPEKLPDGYIGPVKNKPVLLENGNLINASSTEGNGWKIHFEVTEDFGETWRKIGPLDKGPDDINAIQPSVLNHGNGKLQILCRTKSRRVATAWSEDYGETWTALELTSLPNNNSGTDAVTLHDGRHLLIYNHVLPPGEEAKGPRTPLNISQSKDGINWEASLILEDSDISQYSYPSIIQSSDGLVHAVYTWRREKIKYVKIDPDKLNREEIVSLDWPGIEKKESDKPLIHEED